MRRALCDAVTTCGCLQALPHFICLTLVLRIVSLCCFSGAALRELRRDGGVRRGAFLLCSKAGYLPPALAAPGALSAAAAAEAVNGHCIHPDALRASLSRTLANMAVTTLDVLYLHNVAESQLPAVGRAELMRRLRAAFAALEAERASGRIAAYGLATWDSLHVTPEHPSRLDLQDAVDAACDVGGAAHGLRFIQLPVGAATPAPFTQRWHAARPAGAPRDAPRRHGMTLLQAAAALQLAVVASGPLAEGSALRHGTPLASALASPPQTSPLAALPSAATMLLQLARSAPGVTTALVGHKAPAHVAQNTALARVPPLTPDEFEAAVKWLALQR